MPLNNFGLVDTRSSGAKLWRSAQPDSYGFKDLLQFGIDIVFKLNTNDEFPDDRESKYISPSSVSLDPMDPFNPDEDSLRKIVNEIELALVNESSVLVHCTHGRDRTGLVIGAYRALINKWPFDKIQKERDVYGANWLVDIPDHEIVEILKNLSKDNK